VTRLEFTKPTRRDALKRSGQICEAVGARYGLKPDTRCTNKLSYGVEFHHDTEAEMGGDNSLQNCVAVCIPCHRFVTKKFIKELRHSDRVRDRNSGITKPKSRLRKPPGYAYVWGRGYVKQDEANE
jgi:5-methylcytosine-specific restriction endonuclease McrA